MIFDTTLKFMDTIQQDEDKAITEYLKEEGLI